MPTATFRLEGLILVQGARGVIYESLAPELAMAVADSCNWGWGVGLQLGLIVGSEF